MTSEDLEIAVHSTIDAIDRMVASGFYDRGPVWVKAWYSLSLDWSDTNPEYVKYPAEAIDRLLQQAQADRDIFNLATFVAGTRLACGVDLDPTLRDYVSKLLLGIHSPPKARAGRPSKHTWGRDFIIFDAMRYLDISLGISMTQNIERKGERDYETTSSEIVETAVHSSSLRNLTRIQIEKIWASSKVREEYNETIKFRDFYLLDDANDIERS